MVVLFGKPIRVNKSAYNQSDRLSYDIGANLFIGNLDPEVDEKLLFDTFSAFGPIFGSPKVMREGDGGPSRGFGFVSFESFEAADNAIEAMNGQYLCGRTINVTYAYKKDSQSNERHGSAAERCAHTRKETWVVDHSRAPNPTRSRLQSFRSLSAVLHHKTRLLTQLYFFFALNHTCTSYLLQNARIEPTEELVATLQTAYALCGGAAGLAAD